MKPIRLLLGFVVLLGGQGLIYALVGPEGLRRILQTLADGLSMPYNTLLVLMGTGLLGMAVGVIGSFAVLRKRSLVGDAVAHASLPGLAVAFLIMGHRHFGGLIGGAIVFGLLGTLIITWLQRNTRIKADASIGIVLSVFYGLGIVLSRIIQDDPSGRQAGLDSFLLGKTAGMVSQDVMFIAAVGANVVLFTVLLYKEFKLFCFDPGFARVLGWPVLVLDILLLGLLVLTVVIGLPAVGVVLMAAMVIIPGVSARFWTDRLGRMLLLAALFGSFTGVVGTLASARYSEFPAGAVIVLAGTAVFVVSMFFAPRRGIIARVWEKVRFRAKVARQNLLRTLYEAAMSDPAARPPVQLTALLAVRSWKPWQARWLLRRAVGRGDAQASGIDAWRLTEQGLTRAAHVVKSHRLWEMFLVQQASIAADHVDRDADEVEHVLTPALLAELESQLKTSGRWPTPALPASVHPIEGTGSG